MLQYGKGSQYLDVIVADASLPLWRPSFKLDCIITDRKYGSQTGCNLYRSWTNCVKRGRLLGWCRNTLCSWGLHISFLHEWGWRAVLCGINYQKLLKMLAFHKNHQQLTSVIEINNIQAWKYNHLIFALNNYSFITFLFGILSSTHRIVPRWYIGCLSAPYGIREATERIGTTKNYQISNHHLEGHIPSKVEYGLHQIYQDLFQFSAQHLKMGGRLVCWIPVVR